MMPLQLSTQDRRMLAIGVVAMAVLVGGGRGVPVLLRWTRDRRASAASVVEATARAEASVRHSRETQALLGVARTRLAAYDSATLTGSSPATAGAALAEIVSDAASDAEITLGSVQLRGDSISRTALTRVAARASVSGDLNGIALFLETLEGVPELLAIRELSITQSGQAGVPGQPETLRAELLVEGVWRNPERGARR
jgi:hypothetical protein